MTDGKIALEKFTDVPRVPEMRVRTRYPKRRIRNLYGNTVLISRVYSYLSSIKTSYTLVIFIFGPGIADAESTALSTTPSMS